jgi:acyl carrier protein
MNDVQERLVRCFSAVFPELSVAEILHLKQSSTQRWDSIASVTLLSVIEEEFEASVLVNDEIGELSFAAILQYVSGQADPVNVTRHSDK